MRKFTKYWAIFKIQLINSLAYPAELFWRSIIVVLFLWVFAQLWKLPFAGTESGVIAGLTYADTLWYLMLTEAIELSRTRLIRNISEAVKDGSVAYLLNKPYDFLLYQLSTSLGETFFRWLLTTLLGGAMAWLLVGPPPDPRGWPLVLVAILGSWVLNFCMSALIGLLAFVTEEVAPFEWVYQKMIFILGGMLIPLDFFPAWLQNLARCLPFAYQTYGPARLFVDPSLERFAALMLGQFTWIAGLSLLLALAYNRGLRRLAINGG
ncbi:MAG: ABC-2 family transporter protein [Anaerolineales bacterium]|nr:ABC-2 family transporter protein [Anaerolineales bacterium]